MKNRTVLIITAFALAAAIAAMIAGRDALNAVLEDAIHWFHYFAGPIRRGRRLNAAMRQKIKHNPDRSGDGFIQFNKFLDRL